MRWGVAGLVLGLWSCAGPTPPHGDSGGPPASSAPAEGARPRDKVLGQRLFEEGLAHQEQGRHPEALAAFKKAIEADPEHGLAYVHAAQSQQFVDDDLKEIHRLLSRALELVKDSPRAHLRFAEACAAIGDDGAADRHFHRALELKSEWADAHLAYAAFLERVSPPRHDRALASLRTAARLEPSDTRIRVQLADVLDRTGAHQEAAREMENAAVAVGKSAPLFRRAAELYELASAPRDAERMRKIADRIDPPPPKAKKRELRPARGRARR
ncbi:MAG: tetratricopeptide repeat protein [Deltaproteobacteria bacterium]|nr:tetratricopeptide repeat protein [Deltaproteobacteria bacterium]